MTESFNEDAWMSVGRRDADAGLRNHERTGLPQMLDLAAVAELFGRSRRTVRWWIASGRLRAVRIGRTPFVPVGEIEAMIAADAGDAKTPS